MRETQKHKDAFEYWLSLGGGTGQEDARNVSEKCQINERTFWRWYNELGWRDKADQRLSKISQKVSEKTDKSIIDSKATYCKEIQETLAIIKSSIKNAQDETGKSNITPIGAKDLGSLVKAYKDLVELEMKLKGEDIGDNSIKLIVEGVDLTKWHVRKENI